MRHCSCDVTFIVFILIKCKFAFIRYTKFYFNSKKKIKKDILKLSSCIKRIFTQKLTKLVSKFTNDFKLLFKFTILTNLTY